MRAHGGVLRELCSEIAISDVHDPSSGAHGPEIRPFMCIWDTGATGTVVTQRVVDALGLKPVGRTICISANGTYETDEFLVNVLLNNGQIEIPAVRVTLGDFGAGSDVLIGMDIITLGDFCLTNHGGVTVFTFRIPSQGHVDYVQQHEMAKLKAQQAHGGNKAGRVKKKKTFGRHK